MVRCIRILLVVTLLVGAAVPALPAASAQPAVTPNSAYSGGINAITVQGGGSAAEVAAVIEQSSGMSVQALWMFVAGTWLFYLPAMPFIDGGLQFFPQTGAAYAVLAPQQNKVITRADNGGAFTFRVGERFVLDLGEGLVWRVEVDDPKIIESDPVIAIFPPPSRTMWTAKAAGVTTLRATGDMICRYAQPPCLAPDAPSLLFSVRITVVP